jgi:hypothetical protein
MEYTLSPDGSRIINDCPYLSWSQNPETGFWLAPIDYPDDGLFYAWDEESLSWIRPEPQTEPAQAVE